MEEQNTISPQALQGNGSPKSLYTLFVLRLMNNYFETMRRPSEDETGDNIERATIALITFCPVPSERKRLFDMFDRAIQANPGDISRPSALVIGELITFFSGQLDLVEETYATW